MVINLSRNERKWLIELLKASKEDAAINARESLESGDIALLRASGEASSVFERLLAKLYAIKPKGEPDATED